MDNNQSLKNILNTLNMLSAGEMISEHKNMEIRKKVLSRLNKFGFNGAPIAGSTLRLDRRDKNNGKMEY